MKPLVLIASWFGPWPAWIDLYLETCRHNPEVDWLLFTDQPGPSNVPTNVLIVPISLRAFFDRIGAAVGLDLSNINDAYKLCDLRPALGATFKEEIAGYRHYGHCDVDVFFGNIRKFYTDDLLQRYDVISTHAGLVSGHLAVFRNNERVRTAYRKIYRWEDRAVSPEYRSLDEWGLYRVFKARTLWGRLKRALTWKSLFVERHSTVDAGLPWRDGTFNWPAEWRWRSGSITNAADGHHEEYLYLHVMAWHGSRHRRSGSGSAPWPTLQRVVQVGVEQARREGFVVSPAGVRPATGRSEGAMTGSS